jgi:hypothetical protein
MREDHGALYESIFEGNCKRCSDNNLHVGTLEGEKVEPLFKRILFWIYTCNTCGREYVRIQPLSDASLDTIEAAQKHVDEFNEAMELD